MKKRIVQYILFISPCLTLFGQTGYVDVSDEIYLFLDRMNNLGLIEDYNSFELPKPRKEITKHLKSIVMNIDELDNTDRNKLEDFLIEFEYDLISTVFFSSQLFPEFQIEHFINGKEKYLFNYSDKQGNSFFINFLGRTDYLHHTEESTNKNSILYRFGGEIRGSLIENIGFGIIATNGSFLGSRSLAQDYSSLKYNYKFNQENEDNSGDNYFDETAAYLTFQNDFSEIKIGNDRNFIGHGPNKVIFGDESPRMDYISLKLTYKSMNFSFYHGKLLGSYSFSYDSLQGGINELADKYIGYHRLGFNISRHLNFGMGEMVVYANRNIDLSYLNPLSFYKSAEHANQDRDNTFLFFDFQNNTVKGLKFYSTIMIDDIDFSKIGTGWYGNKSILSFGILSNLLYPYIPVDMEIQYLKIDPYVYTHRITDNNFTNLGYNLASDLMPNSSNSNFILYYRPHHRVNMKIGFKYSIHGANILNNDGELVKNYGGDISQGHRPDDSEEIYFLQGEREIYRQLNFESVIEPIKNWHLILKFDYLQNSLAKSQKMEEFFTTFSVSAKL